MPSLPPSPSAIRVSDLGANAQHRFALRPDATACIEIAATLGFTGLRKLNFEGLLRPMGRDDWALEAKLGATVVQDCVVTLEPVTTRIDTDVHRVFARDFEDPQEPEAEMPEDDAVQALGAWIDPEAVMIEALSIAAPDFPRKDGAELGQMVYTAPGAKAMTDADARPFAGLAELKTSLEKDDDEAG
ncbi:MAG: DUF177 domain-containing protein [Pseudomonadota bacterium]